MKAEDIVGGLISVAILTFILLIPIGLLLNLLVPPNEASGQFTDVHSVNFEVTDSSNYKPLVFKLEVSYKMTRVESYRVVVTVEHNGANVSEVTLVIRSTSSVVTTESSGTEVNVPEPGSYTITFSPQGYERSIDFSIEQARTGIFDEAYPLVVGVAAVIASLVVWWGKRPTKAASGGGKKPQPPLPPPPP
jgi:hypothetical protein